MKPERPLTILFVLSFIGLLLLISFVNSSDAKLYQWTDEKGQEHITDYPPPGSKEAEQEKAKETTKEEIHRGIIPDTIRKASPYLSASPGEVQNALQNIYRVAGTLPSQGALFSFVLAGLLVFHVYCSLCLFLISRKAGSPSAFISWIPLLNLFQLPAAAGEPAWWGVIFLIPIIGMFPRVYSGVAPLLALALLTLVAVVMFGRVWMKLCVTLWLNRWSGLLIYVPILQLVFIGYLAFKPDPQSENIHKLRISLYTLFCLGVILGIFFMIRYAKLIPGFH